MHSQLGTFTLDDQRKIVEAGMYARSLFVGTLPQPAYPLSSVEKGRVFEYFALYELIDMFPDAIVHDSTKTAHSGDFLLELDQVKVLVECKNYSNTVEYKEIEKFERDVQEYGAHVGVMVSHRSLIRGKKSVDISRTGTVLFGFVVCRCWEEFRAVGITIRAMIATRCLYTNVVDYERFLSEYKLFKETAACTLKEVHKYTNYTQKHLKTTEELERQLKTVHSQL